MVNDMRSVLLLLNIILVAGAARAEENLVAHYAFDEGTGTVALDGGAHSFDGKIHGAKYVALPEGFALEFDGEDDYVEIPDSPLLQFAGALTVSAWVNTPVNSQQAVVGKNGCSVMRQNYRISLDQGSVFFGLVDCPEHEMTAAGGGVGPDRWYHLAGTYDAERVTVFVNGVATGVLERAFVPGTLDSSLYIGASYYGPGLGAHFTGQIDDVRIYDRALPEAEILAQYEAEKNLRISTRDRLLAQISPTRDRDTTPPTISLPTPPPDTQHEIAPVISARFADRGTGIDPTTARILLNGGDVTTQAQIDARGFAFTPPSNLADGIHAVEVTVADSAGNAGNRLRWRFGLGESVPLVSHFDGDVFRVNDEPHFPIGIYSPNVSPWGPLPYLAQAARAGINYKLIGEHGAVATLNELQALGMKGLVHVYYASLALGKGNPEELTALVESAKDHPANLGWWNEYTSVNQSPLATETYDLITSLDPSHPVIYMLGWGGQLSDAYFVYAYPIFNPLLPDNSIMSSDELVIQPALQMAREEGKGKHMWFASQAFDYRLDMNRGEVVTLEGGFRPSRDEIRAMNYLALTRGAKGLLFYAAGGDIPDTEFANDVALYPRQWTEILKVASELRFLAPTLAAGSTANTARLGQSNEAIQFIELFGGNTHTLIAVNVEPEMVLAEWRFEQPVSLTVLFEDRVSAVRVQSFTDLFEPLQVHVYQWPVAQND